MSLELVVIIIGAVIFFVVLRQYEKKYEKLQAQINANKFATEENKKNIEMNKENIKANTEKLESN